MADNVTAEELAAKEKRPGAPRKPSADAQYDKAAKKWWNAFCKAAAWDPVARMDFLTEEKTPRDGTFRQLFIWMYEQDGMTKSIYKAMLAWAQAELNKQLAAKMEQPRHAYVCNLPGVKDRKDELYTGARKVHMQEMTDLQAELEGDIGFDKMLRSHGG